MILPFMAATLRELLNTVPTQVRESAYGLGATTAEVVLKVTLPYIRRGAIGAVMLGLGRALGETMAVTFIIGNSHDFPKGFFFRGDHRLHHRQRIQRGERPSGVGADRSWPRPVCADLPCAGARPPCSLAQSES